MFRQNQRHRQMTLFGTVHQMPVGAMKMMDKSWAPAFRQLIFEKIEERRYAELYSTVESRPNFPVNIWVGLEIIKWMFDYTDQELLEQFHFNLLTAYALGQESLGEVTLSERTIYYNRERLLEYEAKTGDNLLEDEFHAMTDDALARLPIDSKTQRMDSSFIGSFIKQMSRLELIVKVLQNFYHDLPKAEQTRWSSRLVEYVEDDAKHITYHLKRGEVEEHLKELGAILFELHQAYTDDEGVSSLKSYQHISRVLLEQFNILKERKEISIELKPAREISASSLQNPADDEATFRRKDGEGYKGYIFNATETCAPENPLQLITDTSTHQNIAADDGILAERLPEIKELTGLEEMVVDANYSGENSERVCKEQDVAIIPTEVKGRKVSPNELSLTDFRFDGNSITSCPEGHSPIEQIHKPEHARHIARFAPEQCRNCPRLEHCPVRCRKRFYSLLFSDRQAILAQRRQQLSKEDYRRKCRLRPAIEGTISQFKRKLHNGKLRVRGLRKVRNSVILMAIGINFGRLWAYFMENKPESALFLALVVLVLVFLAKNLVKESTEVKFEVA